MTFDTPLEMWHHVQHRAWFTCYQTESAIYHRDEDHGTFQVFHEKGTGFYHYADTVTELPTKSHPIACQTVDQTYWTHCRLRLMEKKVQQLLPPGLVTYDNLQEHLQEHGRAPAKGKATSDGPVYQREQVAAAAWVIATGTEHQIQACFLMSNVNKVTSSRS